MSDVWIRSMGEKMIKPFVPDNCRMVECIGGAYKRVISYGVSSYGYDIRAANDFKIFTNIDNVVIDPKNFNDLCFKSVKAEGKDFIIIPPNSFALSYSMEYISMPADILGVCLGKSTYARCGIILNTTPLEPSWEGHLTLELSNSTPCPVKVYVGEGIAQLLFLKGDVPCEVSYSDRKGKYQYQNAEVVLPKMHNKNTDSIDMIL